MAVVGIGLLTASAAVATVGDARVFRNGRQFSARLGAVPKQASTGARPGSVTSPGRATPICARCYSRVRAGPDKRPPANRSALALDRPAACTGRLVSNAGGHRQQTRANPLGDPRQRRAPRSLLYPNPSFVTRELHHDPETKNTVQHPKGAAPNTRTLQAWIAKGQTGSRRTRGSNRRRISCVRRAPDGVLLRGYYPGPGTAATVPQQDAMQQESRRPAIAPATTSELNQ
jgi:hypothetical protein